MCSQYSPCDYGRKKWCFGSKWEHFCLGVLLGFFAVVFFFLIFRLFLFCSLKQRTSVDTKCVCYNWLKNIYSIYICRYTEIWQLYGIFTHLSVEWVCLNVKSHILHQNVRTEPQGQWAVCWAYQITSKVALLTSTTLLTIMAVSGVLPMER